MLNVILLCKNDNNFDQVKSNIFDFTNPLESDIQGTLEQVNIHMK